MKGIRSYRKVNALLSLCVCAAMLVTFTLAPAPGVYAASTDTGYSPTATKSAYYIAGHEVGSDLTDVFVYDDELLKGDSGKYNRSLATMTYELAEASMSSDREPRTDAGYANKSRNLRAYLEDNGFVDFDTNEWYKRRMRVDTMGVACAHKKLVDNGKEYTLLVIAPRSAGYEAEWGGNFVMNESAEDTGDHAGFKNGKNIVLAYAKEYIQQYGIKGDIKVWLEGYSRGAGVANQVGAALINRPNEVLGNSVTLTPNNLYCYTFGTPNAASATNGTEGTYSDEKFKYIHNTWEPYDIVTIAPPYAFGFNRYGENKHYASAKNKNRMLMMMEDLNPIVYNLYMNGGDPDKFAPKTIDVEALIKDHMLIIVDDPKSYMTASQMDFMAMMGESINVAISGSPDENARGQYYTDHYQDALMDFCGYYFSHLSDGDLIVDGIKSSKLGIPLVAFMYISYMTERYKDKTFDEETIAEITKAIEQLKAQISEMKAAGEPIPADLEANLVFLESQLVKGAKWEVATQVTRLITAILYSRVIGEGLTKAGLDKEDPELYKRIISSDEAMAMSRILTYLMLYDDKQTDDLISFTTVTQQMQHFATFIENASSFMRPHNNEVISSWLKTNDSNYNDYAKVNAPQLAGYRRLCVAQSDGVVLTAKVKDEAGKVVAKIENGKIVSRTDRWIGITTSDAGDWLRIPVDKTYNVEIKADQATNLDLKVSEYSVYGNEVVREVTRDDRYDWNDLELPAGDMITWFIPAVQEEGYALPSKANYSISKSEVPADWDKDDGGDEKTNNVLAVSGIAKGKKGIKFTWNKVTDAERYVIYMAKCNTSKKSYALKAVKTLAADKQTWTKKGLKKKTKYQFYAVAQKKADGMYVNIANSETGYVATGNRSGKYTNPKSLTVTKTKLTLKVGKAAVIKGKVTKAKAGKKLMTAYAPKLRFVSSDPTVARVEANGKVTPLAAGKCEVYVQTINGIWKTVSVTVQ